MKIRTLTCFFDPALNPPIQVLPRLADFAAAASQAIQQAGFVLQTRRLATSPFPLWHSDQTAAGLTARAVELEALAARHGFTYLSLGPALPAYPAAYSFIPTVLAATRSVFLTGLMTVDNCVDLPAVKACAEAIAHNAPLEENGFANLRFAALGNVSPGSPFLPAAYHAPGKPPAFGLAFECADDILAALESAGNLDAARVNLLERFENTATTLQHLLEPLQSQYGVAFYGFDFSSAPYPQDWCSAGAALEKLGVPRLGQHGSLAAAAFLAETLEMGKWIRTGFNGLMLPVLEDSVLALRAAQGSLTVKDLLLYSTVCGTGLDTVPLPGDSTPEQLASVLLDLAALSLRLDKPLTARLMPMPGKAAGDIIQFDFEFFCAGRVMALEAESIAGHLSNVEKIEIHSRKTAI